MELSTHRVYAAGITPNPDELFMLSIKTECLGRMIFFTEESFRRSIRSYLDHHHSERTHQGLHNRWIEPGDMSQRQPVKSAVANDSVECCGTTSARPRRFFASSFVACPTLASPFHFLDSTANTEWRKHPTRGRSEHFRRLMIRCAREEPSVYWSNEFRARIIGFIARSPCQGLERS